MRDFSLRAALLLSLALFSSACGTGRDPSPVGASMAPAPGNAPSFHESPGICDKNPGCDAFDNTNGSCAYGHGIVCLDYLGSSGQTQAEFKASCEQSLRGQYSTGSARWPISRAAASGWRARPAKQ